MNIEYLTFKEFFPIRDEQLKLFGQLQPLEIFETDEYNDWVVDEKGKPFVIGENKAGVIHYPGLEGIDNRVPQNVINGFDDVFGIDLMINGKEPRIETKIMVLYQDGVYQGSTWIFYDDQYFGIMGIRTSIENYLLKKKGIASMILKEVIQDSDGRRIVVPDPLETMTPLLRQNGFVEEMNEDVCKFYESIYHCNPYFIK